MNILFADDNVIMRRLVVELLEQRNHAVEAVTDGDEILGKIRSGLCPDIIITDINMERMSGLEVLEQIRSDDEFSNVKDTQIVVFSDTNSNVVKKLIERFKATLVDKNAKNLLVAVDAIAAEIAKERG